jgi:hypothetical protein
MHFLAFCIGSLSNYPMQIALKLQSLAFPPYFIRFVERSSAGGLDFLLETLNEPGVRELEEFEREFREGFKFEQLNDLTHAVTVYQQLLPRYPRFGFLIQEHLEFILDTHRAQHGMTQEH